MAAGAAVPNEVGAGAPVAGLAPNAGAAAVGPPKLNVGAEKPAGFADELPAAGELSFFSAGELSFFSAAFKAAVKLNVGCIMSDGFSGAFADDAAG